jgi:hypothetical protein
VIHRDRMAPRLRYWRVPAYLFSAFRLLLLQRCMQKQPFQQKSPDFDSAQRLRPASSKHDLAYQAGRGSWKSTLRNLIPFH